MARLYADEDFPEAAVESLRILGHDVRTVREAGRQGHDDLTVLTDATADSRSVLTHNRRDFLRLHRHLAGMHGGIIACTRDNDAVALANRIDAALSSLPSLWGGLLRVYTP